MTPCLMWIGLTVIALVLILVVPNKFRDLPAWAIRNLLDLNFVFWVVTDLVSQNSKVSLIAILAGLASIRSAMSRRKS